MTLVNFQVLDGMERGEVFSDIPTPVTIGREDDNHIRLNDERVSRFHAKIQEDAGHVILTDLQSTNGTRVNGHPVQVHVLQVGDQVLIGRCLLLYGSPKQVSERVAEIRAKLPHQGELSERTVDERQPGQLFPASGGLAGAETGDPDVPGDLFPGGPPPVPQGLSPLQTAQVSDLIAYMHSNLLRILLAAHETSDDEESPDRWMSVPAEAWHLMQQIEVHLAQMLRSVSDP